MGSHVSQIADEHGKPHKPDDGRPPSALGMKKKAIAILLCCIALYVTYAALTGGIAVQSEHMFRTGRRVADSGIGKDVDISIAGDITDWSMVFVAHYYHVGEPYAIRVSFLDETKTFAKISVTNVTARFKDDEEIATEPAWEKELYETPWGWGVSRTIPNVFDRYDDVTIEMRGELEKTDGTTIPFTVEERFAKQPTFWVTTFWYGISTL